MDVFLELLNFVVMRLFVPYKQNPKLRYLNIKDRDN